ncbi:hypothetical protein [Duganella phyllosphaerae]|uniref:General secretion pathway, M protein n=1 Tax=Duganella phyllosphaerae TaxID=762836 RepID=A0A1E7X7S1_9BURK|nr:hypothetical protein [Duganella phyllosphaerae]OFA09165.1 hypothetical protein DUPY_01160 [Duganella phyllosphaerae]
MKPLKNAWIKVSTKLDAMTLRERALVFLTATGLILFLLYTMAVEPMLSRQAMLLAEIAQQQNQISGIDTEIAARAQGFVVDPDAQARAELNQAQAEIDTVGARLQAVQKGLVAPEKIAPLLEHLLRGNGKLTLVALRTLPVTGMNEAAAPAPPAAPGTAANGVPSAQAQALEQALQQSALQKTPPPATQGAAPGSNPANIAAITAATTPATAPQPMPVPGLGPDPATIATAKPRELLYRHGVEIVLQGSYLDMINTMQALEALPVQLFWGGARLDAQQYPEARLTLTLYTLSLDEQWMKL